MDDIEIQAKKIWDYLRIDDKLKKSDVIVMFGSHDPLVAKYAAQLYLDKWAPLIVFSGARGDGTNDWSDTESERYSTIAKNLGVPNKAILVENKSTNTAENIDFTKKILEKNGIIPKRIIIVQKPYMGRRVFATMKKRWNDIELVITSPPVKFEDYKIPELTRKELIGSMTGDLERLKLYAEKGFQIPQEIPKEVWKARDKIRNAGLVRRYIEV